MWIGKPPFERYLNDDYVMRACRVSRSTVHRWRNGDTAIPHTAWQWLQACALGLVIPEDCPWSGFRFHQGQLWTRSGFAHHPGELDQWHMTRNYAQTLERALEHARAYIVYLERVAPRAEVIKLIEMRPSLTDGQESNGWFQKPKRVD